MFVLALCLVVTVKGCVIILCMYTHTTVWLLKNYSQRMLSPVRLFVCLSSVTLMHHTQAVEIFYNIYTVFGNWTIR